MKLLILALVFSLSLPAQTKVHPEQFPQAIVDALVFADALVKRVAALEERLATLEAFLPENLVVGARLSVDVDDPRIWVFPVARPPADIKKAAIYLGLRLREGVDYEVVSATRIRFLWDIPADSILIADYLQ